MAEETAEELNRARNFSINPTMTEETAKESNRAEESNRLVAQRDNAKEEQHKNRLAAQRKLPKKSCRRITRATYKQACG